MKKQVSILSVLLVFICVSGLQAAFIVEPYDGSTGYQAGLEYDNFTGTPYGWSSGVSAAWGLEAERTAYGNSQPFPDIYVYSYTPGADVDTKLPDYHYWLGNGALATGLEGGQTGYYNVYITWPDTTGVASNCNIIITSDGDDVVLEDIDMNRYGTSPYEGAPGASGAWWQIANEVLLTAGNTYTVTQSAISDEFVSMRSAGVMWEFVAVPEPATLLLLGIGALVLRRRK